MVGGVTGDLMGGQMLFDRWEKSNIPRPGYVLMRGKFSAPSPLRRTPVEF